MAELAAIAEEEVASESEADAGPDAEAKRERPPRRLKNLGSLVKLAKDSRSSAIRGWALEEIKRLDRDSQLMIYAFMLQDDDPQFAALGIQQLRRLRDPRALPYLEALADHSNPRLRQSARSAARALR